ncbi:MAG: hypothetical protein R3C15_08165 [Thermoleophilia bacterium]
MEALLAFVAALLALRLAGDLARRARTTGRGELGLWSAGLAAYAVACGALAWGAAAGWDDRAFRLYYLFGGLLTAPLLACGSLRLRGHTWAKGLALAYAGLSVGLAVAMEVEPHVTGESIPAADEHLAFLPARLVAVLGNAIGTIVLVAVALASLRSRPIANGLVLAGVAVAGAGSAVAGLGEAETSAFVAVAALLLYVGFLWTTDARVRLAALLPGVPDPSRERTDQWPRRRERLS